MRVLSTMTENSVFQDHASNLKKVITKINKNMIWVTQNRRKMASADNFSIVDPEMRKIPGKPPMC